MSANTRSEPNEHISRLASRVVSEDQLDGIKPFGLDMKILLNSEDTGGAFSALVCVHQPGEGPPPHYHNEQDEYFYVLEGSYEMTVDGETSVAGPGTIVFLPRGTVHTFKNNGDAPAKMLDWSLPGGARPLLPRD